MHRTPRPRLVRLAAACAGPVLALGLVVAPTTAQAVTYVALGDSYSSGLGTRSYLDDGTECRRSAQSYPALVAAARGWSLDLRACSGATIPDVRAAQLGALSTSTQKVTLSVGGNDAGFADVLTECALPAWASDCDAAIDQAQATISGTLPSALSSLYAQIGSRAPSADVVVVGYPRVFMGEDCNALTWFSPEEQTRLNATADRLNSLLAARASAAGFRFANPTSAFTGHAVCDDPEWLNGLSNPVEESYHPNVAGHRDGYAPLVGARVASTSVRITAATQEQAAEESDVLTDRARRHTAAGRRIEPQEFQAPDLDSPQVQRAARRLGIDTSDRAEVDRFDRRFAAR